MAESVASELKARLDAERAGEPFLVFRDSAGAQRIVPLGDQARLTIGRDPRADVALAWDVETSRLHAELIRVGTEWTVLDDGLSRNGTFVNGRRLAGRRRLRDGDTLRLGRTAIVYRDPADAAAEETARAVAAGPPELTPAQRRVLIALCRPWRAGAEHAMPASNREIADELVVSIDAVKANLRALFDRFGVEELPQNRKRARLVELAFATGAVTMREL